MRDASSLRNESESCHDTRSYALHPPPQKATGDTQWGSTMSGLTPLVKYQDDIDKWERSMDNRTSTGRNLT